MAVFYKVLIFCASLLGGLTHGGDWGNKDLNNAPDNSLVTAAPIVTGGANYPTGVARGFTITRHIGGNKWQEFYELSGDSYRQIITHWYRNFVSDTWYPWMMVPLADSKEGLATILGVIPLSSTSDLDNLPKKFGFYRFSGTSPFAVHSLVIHCVFPNLTYGFQVVIERAYNKIYMRNLTNDVWETTWASITLS